MTKLVRFLSVLAGAWVGLWAVPAEAQTITLPNTGVNVERDDPRSDSEQPLKISRQDCFDGAPQGFGNSGIDDPEPYTWLVMEPRIQGLSPNSYVEVWASESANCTDIQQQTNTGSCWIVAREDNPSLTDTILYINPRDLVTRDKDVVTFDASLERSVEICEADANQVERSLKLYVMVRSGDDTVDAHEVWSQTALDLSAPPPPDEFSVGTGDEYFFFEWDIDSANEDPDTYGFVFYCVPQGTTVTEEPDPTGTGGDGTGGDGTGSDGTGGDGTGGDGTNLGGAGGAASLACNQNVLVEGEFASAEAKEYECGEVLGRSARKGQSNRRENNVEYAVAVAARDNVGNSGKLKVLSSCPMPQEVTTFYEGYEQSGGKGGGGFCGFETRSTGALWWLLLASGGAFIARRRKVA